MYPIFTILNVFVFKIRIGSIVCQQYISLELALQSQQTVFDDKPFALQRHQAYNMVSIFPLKLVVLHIVRHMTEIISFCT